LSKRRAPVNHASWRQLLDLGEQLLVSPTVAAQRERIVETAASLLAAQADLWLAGPVRRPPRAEDPPPAPPSQLARRALESRQMVSDPDVGTSDGPTAVAVPLLADGTVIAVLEVTRASGPPFTEPEIEILRGVATQSCIGLQATRQLATERWRVEQLALVRTVSAQVARILDLDELSLRVTDLVLDTFQYYYVALFSLEPGQEVLRCRASAGRSPDGTGSRAARPELPPIHLGEGIIGQVAQTGTEILASDVTREPRYRSSDALPETRSEVALPLKIEDRILGVLDVQSDQPDDFDQADLLVLRALADSIAIAVEDARLYGALRRRADQLSAIAEASRAVVSILDLDQLFGEVVRLVSRQFEYPFVHLLTVDPARGQIVYRAGTGPRGAVLQEQGLVCPLDDPAGIVPWVTCHGETVLANDLSQDPRYRPSKFSEAGARSELAVPLQFGNEVLGVLDVQSEHRDAFSDEDRPLFEALADSVAIAIRNANLYRSERWRRQVADSMREVAGLLSAEVALDQVLDAILSQLERSLPCDAAAIWLLSGEDLCLSAVRGAPANVCVSRLSPGDGLWLWQTLDADEPMVRTAASSYEPLGAVLGFPPDYSAIAVPLRAGERRLGVLTLVHRSSGRYGTESRMMTSAFASYAAVAIENTRLFQESQELALISTVMLRVVEGTQMLATLDQVLETVVQLVPMLAGVERCGILLWDELATAFLPAAAYGLSATEQAVFDGWRPAPTAEPVFDDLRRDKAPIFIYDVATDSRLAGTEAWTLGFDSLLLLPLLARGEVLGVILVDYQSEGAGADALGTLRDERLAMVQGIAHQTAAAVESARLREAQQEDAYVSTALLQVAQAVASLTELDDILSTIVRITPLLVGVERLVVFVWDEELGVFQALQAYGMPRDLAGEPEGRSSLSALCYAPGDFPLLDAAREQRHLLVQPSGEVADFLGELDRSTPPEFPAVGEQPRSLLAVPLSMQNQVLGVMLLEEAAAPRHSLDRRHEIINGIAQQVAVALQNDHLRREVAERERLERELQLAHQIQRTFIPSELPHLPGWELAASWRAARQMAGDFYDLFELPGRRMGLVIADVADKGMSAALFMVLTRTLVRAAALEEPSPAAVLARVNDLLVPDAQQGMFVTAFYAVVSLETGEVAYASAGHNLPLLLRPRSGELDLLAKGGMALGVLEGNRFQDQVTSLEPGDSLILYTDGVSEAFSSEGDIYGEERLRQSIRAADGASARAVLEAIDRDMAAFVGDGPPSDDVTLVVLHRTE